MTKKTSHKKKVSVKLMPGEAIFVASTEVLEHIIYTYNLLGDTEDSPENKEHWYGVAQAVEEWLNNTINNTEENEVEEDW
jgi:hypothetical protein